MSIGIDLPPCAGLWSEQEVGLFNKLDFYFAKNQVRLIKYFNTWPKLLSKSKWTPKSGKIMKSVRKEKSPILRSQFLPNTIQLAAKKDVVQLSERVEQAQLYHHKVESNLLHFLPDFQDFLDNVDPTNEDISEKITILPDQFYRTAIFHGSPNVYVCGAATPLVQNVPYWTGATIGLAKDTATLASLCAQAISSLSMKTVHRLKQIMFSDLAATPYSGDLLADGTNGEFLAQKYVIVGGAEVFDNWTFDPFLLDNRPLNMDIIREGFRGSLWGQITYKIERYEIRILADGTMPAPETLELGANAFNKGEVIPNPDYVNAPYAVAFMLGEDAYDAISPGPPPAPFTKGGMSISEFNAMDWNGKVIFTRNFLTKCLDANGTETLDTNKYGEFVQVISHISMGIIGKRRQNILPIIYARARVNVSA